MSERKDIESIMRGDDIILEIIVTDESGVAIDIADDKFWFTVKESPKDPDVIALVQVTAIAIAGNDSSSGKLQIQLSSVDTFVASGNHYYDLQQQKIGSGNSEIETLQHGRVSFTQDTTHATE